MATLRLMRPFETDLFGEVIVTRADVRAWLLAVPKLDPDSRSAARYVHQYAVIDKIKQAKLAGHFDDVVLRPAPPSGQWWERFDWTMR